MSFWKNMNFLQDLSEWNAAGMKSIINKYTVYPYKLWKRHRISICSFLGVMEKEQQFTALLTKPELSAGSA